MAGRHRKKVPVLHRLARIGLVISAVTVLLVAYFSQPVAISTSAELPRSPRFDITTSESRPTTIPSSPARTKIKKKRQAAQLDSPKIEKDQAVTPVDPPSIKLPRTPGPHTRQDRVRSTTGQPSRKVDSPSRSVLKTTAPKKTVIPKTKESPIPKVEIKKTTIPRVVIPSRKPQTVVAQPPPVPILTSNSRCSSIGLLPTPKAACNTVLAAFPEIKSVLGVGGRAGNPNSCHPKGLAIDFIVGTNKALGDRLYAFVIARRSALGATPVVLWQVADHFDHVHVSFDPCKG